MHVIITGKDGFIARKLVDILKSKHEVITTSSEKRKDCLFLDLIRPETFDYDFIANDDFIIHLAGISSPDICKNKYNFAYSINVKGTTYFLKECLSREAKVLFFSSDTVYGSSENFTRPFDENSACNPVGCYAQMKYEVEKEFLNEKNLKIFRLSYVFSKDDKFTSYLVNCSKKNTISEIFHPFYRNLIYIGDLIDAVTSLIDKWQEFDNQIFNICGEEPVSRKDIAELYRKIVDNKLEIKIVKPSQDFFNERPKIINTKSLYLQKLIGHKLFNLKKAMEKEFVN